MSFAICSAGEIVILAIMVGILKGLKSDESVENNTKAFSVLIAFAGGVWCAYFLNIFSIYLTLLYSSALCSPLVLPWATAAWPGLPVGNELLDNRNQTSLCSIQRVLEAQTDLPLSHILLSYVGKYLLSNIRNLTRNQGRCTEYHGVSSCFLDPVFSKMNLLIQNCYQYATK